MKNFSLYFLLFTVGINLVNCSNVNQNSGKSKSSGSEIGALYQKVVTRLSQDSTAHFTCNALFTKYEIDTKLNDPSLTYFYEFYYQSYNAGNGFTRLINIDSLSAFFQNKQINRKDFGISRTEFLEIINNYNNFNSDENLGGNYEQLFYFSEYIEKGLILPQTD
jgi:hypothetical protein